MKDEKQKFMNQLKEKAKNEIKDKGIQYISEILNKIREEYLSRISNFVKDPERSWKPFKGKLVEEIIMNEIHNKVEEIGLKIIKGSELEKEEINLEDCLAFVKRSLIVDSGKYGMHLPDADLVIYDPQKCKAIAIISSKTTLRERIAQVGYGYLKIKGSPITKNIKVFFITLDEDGDLVVRKPAKKGRAIAETDTDGTFVITNRELQESEKVKTIEKFFDVLKLL